MVSQSVPGVELDGTLEFSFGSAPVPVPHIFDLSGSNMAIANHVVQSQSLRSRGSGERNTGFGIKIVTGQIRFSQAGIGKSIVWVLLNRLKKTLARGTP